MLLALLAGSALGGPDDADGSAYFEKRVRPLLAKHCYSCHSAKAKKLKAELRLDTREGVLRGGTTGAALVPGKPDKSLIIRAVGYADADLQMPPKYKLTDREVDVLVQWIRMGAPDPREATAADAPAPKRIDLEEGRRFWAFRPVRRPGLPKVRDTAWPAGDLDRFVLARLEAAGLRPAGDAGRETLLRRVTFDLVGLPPTTEEIDAFLSDRSTDAFEKVVDRLLASRHFGERWGRHWLDVARYAESMGRTRNYAFPFAWRYRDYVIGAFNRDKPYDRFVREQIAGDLLADASGSDRIDALLGAGFIALGSHDLNERNTAQYLMDVVDEQMDTAARAFMALTLGCARCHDHKFDPIPQSDYYALAGIFRSTETLNGYANRGRGGGKNYGKGDRLMSLGGADEAETRALDEHQRRVAEMERRRKEMQARAKKLKGSEAKAIRAELKRLAKALQDLKKDGPQRSDLAMSARDGTVQDCRILLKGEVEHPGREVDRGFLQVLSAVPAAEIPGNASGRLQLADWLTRPEHPLTSRVMVNRVWHHLFGRGLVATVDNFGQTGDRPTHPDLLDHLASGFVEDGWSVKRLIRRIVLSRAYRMDAVGDSAAEDTDPSNLLLWRQNPRRLEAEILRDAMLAVAGTLDLEPAGPSPVQRLGLKQVGGKGAPKRGSGGDPFRHRSIYRPILRGVEPGMMETFDFPEPSQLVGRRDATTVATQALFMMNNRFVLEQSEKTAGRILGERSLDDAGRVALAYRRTLGRGPTETETSRALAYVASGGRDAWTGLCQVLFASAEFRYVN